MTAPDLTITPLSGCSLSGVGAVASPYLLRLSAFFAVVTPQWRPVRLQRSHSRNSFIAVRRNRVASRQGAGYTAKSVRSSRDNTLTWSSRKVPL